ncbi:MAG: GspE/PulE family protein [Candidatus Hydrogenedentes bacterium]|nr:GspE/PulE family protein [Candidatus Hydrogenedentota bacterium]
MTSLRIIERGGDESSPGREPFEAIEARLRERLARGGDSAAVDAVDLILIQAVPHRASDIHFEPWRDSLTIRYRIDGILHDVAQLPREFHAWITTRLKVIARIATYHRDVPQDGRIEPDATPSGRAMRVSTFPTVNGEKVTVRMLDTPDGMLALDALGFDADLTGALQELIGRPSGTLLLTGPSSSGKTTTIYALLQAIVQSRDPAPHVVAIEDPVEYRMPKITQTEINPHTGLTYEEALRAVLRQDPEVIMLGEIRDPATAHAAIQAGLTGHLVISTIHSGTAAGVFTRLLDMGIEPFLIASSVTGVLAQRLVRKNCPACSAPVVPDERLCARFGVVPESGTFRAGSGCPNCEGIGFRGRTAVGELLMADETVAELILSRARTATIHRAAVVAGMTSLEDAALACAETGITTLDEMRRVLPAGMT